MDRADDGIIEESSDFPPEVARARAERPDCALSSSLSSSLRVADGRATESREEEWWIRCPEDAFARLLSRRKTVRPLDVEREEHAGGGGRGPLGGSAAKRWAWSWSSKGGAPEGLRGAPGGVRDDVPSLPAFPLPHPGGDAFEALLPGLSSLLREFFGEEARGDGGWGGPGMEPPPPQAPLPGGAPPGSAAGAGAERRRPALPRVAGAGAEQRRPALPPLAERERGRGVDI
jgi:hypothetical protein